VTDPPSVVDQEPEREMPSVSPIVAPLGLTAELSKVTLQGIGNGTTINRIIATTITATTVAIFLATRPSCCGMITVCREVAVRSRPESGYCSFVPFAPREEDRTCSSSIAPHDRQNIAPGRIAAPHSSQNMRPRNSSSYAIGSKNVRRRRLEAENLAGSVCWPACRDGRSKST